MIYHKSFFWTLTIVAGLASACSQQTNSFTADQPDVSTDEDVKTEILQVLNDETAAAFSRDYDAWQDKWIHEPYVTKTYMRFIDTSMTETIGWKEIDQYLKNYFIQHPEPDPLPDWLKDIEVRVYGTGAWVSYTQFEESRGRKRETRLMEKQNGKWKIAGMHTTVYSSK